MTRTIALAVGLLCLTCDVASHGKEPTSKVYRVQHVQAGEIAIDGKLGDSEWPADGWEADFSFPWRKRKTPRTEMCCVCDGKRLLFAFQCDDSGLVLRGAVPKDEMTVAQGDRVELFFARDPALKKYFCLEMSPAGIVLDYRACFYRKFDDSWDCPGLVLATGTHRDGYVVEGAIPVAALKELCGANASQGKLLVGAFRAEYSHTDSSAPEEAWISWIHPNVQEPDFHIPSAFGTFHLQD